MCTIVRDSGVTDFQCRAIVVEDAISKHPAAAKGGHVSRNDGIGNGNAASVITDAPASRCLITGYRSIGDNKCSFNIMYGAAVIADVTRYRAIVRYYDVTDLVVNATTVFSDVPGNGRVADGKVA